MLFVSGDRPRLFGLPPGADFADAVVRGLLARLPDDRPEALARVTILVNTRRMQRRLREVFDAGPARLLPRLRLITDLGRDPVSADLPPAVSPLRRRLELAQLVAGLLRRTTDLAPRAALHDLSESLARLMDEMHGEGVGPDAIAALNVEDQSGHWARSLAFLTIVQRYFGDSADAPDTERRQRAVIERMVADWSARPPADPVLVAGSTGSRGATALLLAAVARLPQGAVILPGFDFDLPAGVWADLDDAMTGEDHPQFRFRSLMSQTGLGPGDIRPWHDAAPSAPLRNRLVSLSLRPAPVTDGWHADGPALGDLIVATQGLTLLEAPSQRIEAEAIALRLRHAVEEGITAALITPDRGLTRQVAAALDRWAVTADDSAGMPLPLAPPGLFLRMTAALFGARLTAATLLTLFKHPLCHSGPAGRGDHLRWTHDLELHLRKKGSAFPDGASLIAWAKGMPDDGRLAWAEWLAALLDPLAGIADRPLTDHLEQHIALTEALAAGPGPAGSGRLWQEAAGRTARAACDDLRRHADAGGILSPVEYQSLFHGHLGNHEVRNPDIGHPRIRIWGTLEARVQGADLMILAGMNDGIWPETPAPDPWLNRTMRRDAGLLLPERRIGLSAHDYQQAVAAAEVWITRSIRSDQADTVPSRWINRLVNLIGGLPDQNGPEALSRMRQRARPWLDGALAQSIAERVAPAVRPAPRPPLAHRPGRLSVTAINTLIRDPYSIYARHILNLHPLDPLTPLADAPMRGTVLHKVFERFIDARIPPDTPEARDRLMAITAEVLAESCPWPTIRHLWTARIARVADWFLSGEIDRQALGRPEVLERRGAVTMDDLGFTLTAKADRIDLNDAGEALIYDYKTGAPPSDKAQKAFDKQLLLEAALVAEGGFGSIGPVAVRSATYIGLGAQPSLVDAPLEAMPPQAVWNELRDLVRLWAMPAQGYAALFRPQLTNFAGDYDHLARRGEWDLSTQYTPQDVP